MGVIKSLLVGGLALTGLYEVHKWWMSKNAKLSLITGHMYACTFFYTKDAPEPMSQAMLQTALDASHPSMYNVLRAANTPGPQSAIRAVGALIQVVGTSEDVTAADFTENWPAGFGTVTLAAPPIDMGALQTAATAALAVAP